jgi:hypothetical protein
MTYPMTYPTLKAEPTHTGAGSLRPTTLPQVKIPTFLYNVT